MKSLTIKDLARTTELDRHAMAGVSGGGSKEYKGMMPYSVYSVDASKDSFSFDATQLVSQNQATTVNNGNNVAFACDISACVKPTQKADNTINFGH
ncbi:hypothetical protein EDC30_10811 [Paucimonas lemoignei]|uniref:Uncharacterized protein n=1 Tax=Paucimonas lemoignei TaxID=29443 RepID=A0A4R3HSM3_PAULE|nr:hypothetical protein [Paucimonas lemoignei]TCS35948.1 hypothetical protein EDC30_10811 [Paucimonas lemoignei]